MDIKHLQQLVEIVKAGSIEKAADRTGEMPETLRENMDKLTGKFGAEIFEENGDEAILTPFGLDVYRQSKDICQRLEFLQSTAREEELGHLNIASMYSSLANEAFVEMYQRHYKDAFIGKMEQCMLPETINRVTTGLAEIGIITLFSDSEGMSLRLLEEKDLEFEQIVKRRLYAIVGPENPLYNEDRQWIDLSEIKDFPYIVNYASPSDYAWERALRGRRHKRSEIHVSDLGCALQLIDRTDAVMIDTYDQKTYEALYAKNRCKFILIKDSPLSCRLGYIKLKNKDLSQACVEYLRILTDMAEAVAR